MAYDRDAHYLPTYFYWWPKVFGIYLKKAKIDGLLSGVCCARGAPKISHLFFANDSILFGRANVVSCDVIKDVLCKYEVASGQAINFQKSVVSFCPNLSDDDQGMILSSLGLSNSDPHDVY